MIGTEFLKGQGLGNQLFCYVTARCIAKERGCEFATAGQEQLAVNIHSKKGMYFMKMDLGAAISPEEVPRQGDEACGAGQEGRGTAAPGGKTVCGAEGTAESAARSRTLKRYDEKELRFFMGTSAHDMSHGCYVAGADEALLGLPDNTLIYGNMQAERYFAKYREDIREWLRVLPEYDTHEFTRDNLCIINVRGGEYTGHPELYLERKYWLNGIKNMRRIRPDMEFIIVTDDPEAAGKLLPGIPVYHSDLDRDYVMIKNARYLLLSNSSFAFFPAYTSETLQFAIAPKYWARHNVSDGYWASEQNIYSLFHYQDRKGRLFTPEECLRELAEYKKTSAKYRNAGVRPEGTARKLCVLKSKWIYGIFYLKKICYSLMRRAGFNFARYAPKGI